MTLNPVCESVETAQGVPLTVTGVAQVKIMKNADLLQTASEQFLGKKEHEIKSTVLQTLEGHLRAILGKKTEYVLTVVVDESGIRISLNLSLVKIELTLDFNPICLNTTSRL